MNAYETTLGEIAHEGIVAPLHGHFSSWKVDLDIIDGAENSFERTAFKVGKPREVPDLEKWPTLYAERVLVEKEGVGESTATPQPTHPGVWRIVHEPSAAMGGHKGLPGYAIVPGALHVQTLPEDHPFVLSATYAKYGIAVTRRHDSEQRATSLYDLFGAGEPVGPILNASVDAFLADGELLRGKDLVAWVTLGKMHMPRSEDMPLVTNFGTSFHLVPWNLFPKNQGMDIPSLRQFVKPSPTKHPHPHPHPPAHQSHQPPRRPHSH